MRTICYIAAFSLCLAACSAGQATPPLANLSGPSNDAVSHSLSLTPFNAPTSVFPGATTTEPTGIRPGFISVTVTLQDGATVGGIYDRNSQTWVQIDYPDGASTATYGPQAIPGGYRVVGSFKDSLQMGDTAFVYDSVKDEYLPIHTPAHLCAPKKCNYTIAHSIFGYPSYRVVGNYDAAYTPKQAGAAPVGGHAFLYKSTGRTFTTIDVAGAISTTAYGIWVNGKRVIVAGGYTDKKGRHAYVRDLTTQGIVSYDYPKAALTHFEGIAGAGGYGNYNLVGDYTKPRSKAVYGFYIQMRNWKFQNPVVIGKLTANSVSDRDVIGVYNPGSNISGFITTIPATDPQ
jgi:subtilase-type serine protease